MTQECEEEGPVSQSHEGAPFFSLQIRVVGFLDAFGIFVGAVSVAGFLSAYHWAFDLFCHFRFQYAVSLSMVTFALVALKRWRMAAGIGAVALVNILTILPFLIPHSSLPESGAPTRVFLHANVERGRGDKERVADLIRTTDADMVHLCEIDYAWMKALEDILEPYPHRIVEKRQDNFGIGLFSKHPFKKGLITRIGPADIPSCLAIVQLPEATVTVIGTHPIPPGGFRRSSLRDRQLEALASGIAKATPPIILTGDLNVSPWSSHFRSLLSEANLRDSGEGWGFQPTWGANNWFLWTPIDHFLHSEEIQIVGREVGPDVGSDHYPLRVRFRAGD